MSAEMAMKRLRSSAAHTICGDSRQEAGPNTLEEEDDVSDDDEDAQLNANQRNKGSATATTYDDLDAMEATVLGRPGSLLVP